MKNGFVKIGTFVPKIKVCDVSFNGKAIERGINLAKEKDVEILLFPELALTGATAGDYFYSDALISSASTEAERIAKSTQNTEMLVFLGAPVKKDGRVYDAVIGINKGKIIGVVPRCVISGAIDEYGKNAFSSFDCEDSEIKMGGNSVPFGNLIFTEEKKGYGVALCVGADLFSEIPRSLSLSGAQIVLCPNSFPEIVEMDDIVKTALESESRNCLAALISVSAGEGESTTDEVFGGLSFGCECGKPLFTSPAFNEGLSVTEVDVEYIDFERTKRFKNEGKEDAVTVCFTADRDGALTRKFKKNPFVPEDPEKRKIRCERILETQARGLKKRMEHVFAKKLVLGLSGGLDSTLALLVCERAVKLSGKDTKDIITCTMPCFGTTSRTFDNTLKLSKAIGTTLKKIDIGKAVERHLKDIKHEKGKTDAAYENAQARERSQVLLDIANMENGLVVGTGDMSEIALGWCTFNGDHISNYGVNCTVVKTLARAIVETVANERKGKVKAVLEDILDTPVSPELIPGENDKIAQQTEDIVGPYRLHDFFLYHLIRRGSTPKKVYAIACDTFSDEYDKDTVLKWLKVFVKRFVSQQFKRSCSPDGVRVGNLDLSPRGSFSAPSDASADVWLKDLENI